MANAVQAKLRFGPDTYKVSPAATGANAVDGGRLVEFDGANPGTIKLCTVDSTKWLGVALQFALPTNTDPTLTIPSGHPAAILEDIPGEVGVGWIGEWKLTATNATLAQGDIVYPGALGLIQKATTTGRAVGIVLEPGGIAANGTGLVRLFL